VDASAWRTSSKKVGPFLANIAIPVSKRKMIQSNAAARFSRADVLWCRLPAAYEIHAGWKPAPQFRADGESIVAGDWMSISIPGRRRFARRVSRVN